MSDDDAPEKELGPSVPSGAVSRELQIINKRGLHARASAKFVQMVEKFNAEVPDAPGVRYACVVGGIRESGVPLAIAPAHAYLRRLAGPNDGLVPIASQFWGETLAEIEADHFAQIGWNLGVRKTFDALGLYAFVVARLGDVGALQAAANT